MDEVSSCSSNLNSNLNLNLNSYEQVVKKLINIFKFKREDNLKQLEDLWDSISRAQNEPNNQLSTSNNNSKNSSNSNSNNLNVNSINKRNLSESNLNTNQQHKKQKITVLDNIDQSSTGSNASNSSTGSNQSNLVDFEFDFGCFICKELYQELNNKLIECKKCTKLYHQLCHVPRIEQSKITSGLDGKLVWYFDKCQSCLSKDQEQNNEELNKAKIINTDEPKQSKGLAGLANKLTNNNNNNNSINNNHKLKQSNTNNSILQNKKLTNSSLSNSNSNLHKSNSSNTKPLFNLNSTSQKQALTTVGLHNKK